MDDQCTRLVAEVDQVPALQEVYSTKVGCEPLQVARNFRVEGQRVVGVVRAVVEHAAVVVGHKRHVQAQVVQFGSGHQQVLIFGGSTGRGCGDVEQVLQVQRRDQVVLVHLVHRDLPELLPHLAFKSATS